MKTLRTVLNFVCMIALLLGLTSYTPAAASNVENVFHHTQSAPRLAKALVGRPAGVAPSGLSDSEWASIQEQIRAAEYHISRQVQEGQDVYRASNQAQGFDAAFSAQGLSATAQPDIQSPWNFGLTLQAYGGQPVLDASLSAERAQVTATHSSAVKEWYENTPQGVKHGLTLYAPPENGSLTLDFAISGSLQARQAPDGGLHLYDASGEAMLTYDNLAVYDASGKLLSANMSLIPGGLRIAINAAGAVYPITVDPLLHTPLITLRASDPEAYDWFGGAVAIDGDTLVVGAPGYPITYTGAAYVFERNQDGTDAWGEVAILYASDAQQGDEFGASVSISGDIIVVGAPDADDGAYTGNGAAYVFYRNQGGADLWGEVKILYGSSPNDFDYFGISVDIDGDTIVVGAENKWGGYGWAHVFQRNFGGEDYWGEIAYISGFGSGPGDYFGHSVAIAGDTIVVGAPGEVGTGRAYVFSRNWDGEDTWGRVADLSASDMQSGDNFGWSVDISADTLVVGAYSEDGGTDDPLPGAGAAYVFQRNQGGADLWGEVAILRASDAQSDDNLGASVAIAGDTIVVGADQEDGGFGDLLPNSGAAYVYSRNQGGADAWGEINILHSSEAETEDYFGISAAISGDTIVVGSENEDGGPGSPLPEAGAAYLFTATGVWLEIAALHIGDPQFGEHFGIATAVDDNTLVVGAPEINMAYVFYRNQGGADTWAEAAALWASDGKIGDWFGHSVAIAGDTIVVGAYGDDGPGEIQPYAGAAYIFQRNQGGADTWGEVTILHASDAQAGDQFGLSLSIDDETIVVGAPTEDGGGGDPYDNAGAAYVFSRNQGGADAWGEVAILHASDAEPSDGFGISVSISADTIVAGAHNEDGGLGSPALSAGAAYVFSRNQGGVDAWGEVKIMRASDAQAGDIFGVSVAISGDTIVVGASQEDGGAGDPLLLAGAAYVFSRNQGGAENWGEMTILRAADAQAGDGFGRVSISGDAIVVGADYEDGGPGDPLTDSGAAYVFGRNQGGADHWGQVRTLHASDAQANDTFGSVAISGDTLIVGAYSEDGGAGDFYPDTGAAYIFTLQANWEPTPLPQPLESEASDLFGAVALSGDTLVVGAHGADAGAGAAYVFYRDQISAYQWYQVAVLAASDAQPGDNFGWAVAVYSDTVVIGAPYHDQITDTLVLTDAGAAYVFQRDQGGDDAWGQTAILYASDAQDGDHFGYSVSIDGGTIAIGAPGANYDLFPGAGAVYLFAFTPTRAPADWGQVGTLNADPGAGANEAFGSSVDLDGDNLAVGAPGAAVGPLSGAGEVYMFANNGTRATNDWGQVGTLSAEPGAGQGDAFGSDVDLDGGSLVVGAPYEDGPLDLVPDAGAAYVFESTSLLNGRTPTDWGQVGTLSAGPGAGAGDCFGSSVASSGGTMIVGAPNEDGGVGDPITDTGVAYVFMTAPLQHSPDSFGVEQILRATEAQIGDQFGSLIALQGATVAIGAPYEDGGPGDPITNTGAAYIFNLVLPNLPPQAVDDEYELSSDSSNNVLDVLSNDSDSNLDPLVVTAVGAPAHGAAQDNDLNVLYTPDPGYGGTDTFTYTITDGNGGYNTAQVTVIIPAAPIADDLSFSMPEDSSHTGLLTASDPDSAVLTFTLQTAPLHGTALIEANGVFTYTPASEYSGADGFTFIVSDGALTDTGQVAITVTSVAYATALDLLAQPSPSGVGQVVTFTATVSAAIGNPAGTLVFREGATTLLTTTLDADGAAVFTTHTLPWGDHPITAEYLGAVDFLPSSSTLTHTVAYMADLQVSMIPMLIPMGMQYTIEVHNPGFNDAGGTRVQADISDALTDVQWQCSASDGATCTPGGVGDIDDILVNLPAGSTVTYTVTAHREIWHSVNATIIITPPLGFIDPDPVNNQVIYTGLFTYRLPMLIRSE